MMERSTQSLSGGEKRRVAIALVLGFAELIATRGQLSCNVAVFDEASDYVQVSYPCDGLSQHGTDVNYSGFMFEFCCLSCICFRPCRLPKRPIAAHVNGNIAMLALVHLGRFAWIASC